MINQSCAKSWVLIYPKQSDKDKILTQAYCDCATKKLPDEVVKPADSLTDKEYYSRIDTIADHCSGEALNTKPTSKK